MRHTIHVVVFVSALDKEKYYFRQQSAPQFRRGGSRAGLAGFTSYMFPGQSMFVNISAGFVLLENIEQNITPGIS